MPVINLQRSMTEVGRIRLGTKIRGSNGRERPAKLDRLRFTSPRKGLIGRIAELYGGTVSPWQPPKGAQQWQVITNVSEVPVVVPPQDPAETQWYEMWSQGGCLRRCDGRQETLSKSACLCDPAARDCKIYTRLRVMLEDVPGLGVWLVNTGSYYAAVELPGIAQLLATTQGAIPGRLVLDQRTVTRTVNGETKTLHFVVPTLHVDLTPKQLMSGHVQELIAARNRAAVAGEVRAAIAATVDYPSLIDAARTIDALYEIAEKVKEGNSGQIPPDLTALFERKAAAIRSAQPREGAVAAKPVEPSADEADELWLQILAASPWEDKNELERHFRELVGRSLDEASVDDMRRFLAAQAKAGEAA